jgi:hypothetical protein
MFHQKSCRCDECIIQEVQQALEGQGPIQAVLLAAWSFAASDLPFWASALWPLIFRIETAHKEGDTDGHAEEELRTVLGHAEEDARAGRFP